jgi:RHS repeat-associated protein
MNVVQERSSANTPTAAYTRGPDLSGTLQGAGGIGGMLARSHGYSGGSWSTHNFYHADGMGNITFMANNSPAPAMVAKYKYDPYGRTITATGPLAAANLYRFSSKEINPATGMYYFGYRFYNPAIQRWMNRDPLEERAGLNLYDFTHNRPIWGVDTDGRFVQYLPTLAVGVGAGGLGISAGGVIALTTCAVPACLITGALLFNPPEPSPATYPSTGPRNAAPSSVQCDRKIIPFPGPRPSPKPAPEPEPEVPPPPGYERCTKNWDNNNPDPSQRVCFFECPSDGLLIMRTGKECNADHVPRRIPTP